MAATALVRSTGAGAAIAPRSETVGELSRDQLNAVKDVIAPGATDVELELFYLVCKRTKLDPFAKQIYAIKRSVKAANGNGHEDRITFQVSVDGFRLTAQRSGEYEGQTTPQFAGADGAWRDLWLDTKPPLACRVGVYRAGFREPLYVVALWREYVQSTRDGSATKMWREKPSIMLAKCAEALALRKAFPAELSGLYVEEELERDDENAAPAPPEPVKRTAARPAIAVVASVSTPPADVVIPFGKLKGTKLADVETSRLELWRDEWAANDEAKAKVIERLGESFVLAVYAVLETRLGDETASAPVEPVREAAPVAASPAPAKVPAATPAPLDDELPF